MVIVKINRENRRITAFSISGHADAGPYGHDLVCAGVSAISFGTVNAIEALCGIQLHIDSEEDGGHLRGRVPALGSDDDSRVQLLLEGMVVSMQSMAKEYGEYITLLDEGSE